MRRWFGSITATIALTVVIATLLGFSLQQVVRTGLPYLGLARQERPQPGSVRFLRQLPGRIATLVQVLDRVPDAERPTIISAAQAPKLHFDLRESPAPGVVNRDQPDAQLLRRRIEDLLTVPRPVVVTDHYRVADQQGNTNRTPVESGVVTEVALADGHWLVSYSAFNAPQVSDPVADKFSKASFATWLALSILLAVLLSALAARRLVKPLHKLASAAEQVGGSGNAQPLPLDGPREVQGTIQAFNRMQERLRRFNEDRTRMIAAISHDLRTPLMRLQLRLDVVEDADERQKMLAELETMGAMIESVLSFARDDTKHEARSLVDMSALVEGICEDASDAGEPVTFSGPRNVTISCRPTVMRRAISNLVDNAVKYGGSAAVTLVPEAGCVVILVEDNGPGIPRTAREKVFEPFYRLEMSRNSETGGVGLGLSVARSIVWEHGGDIILANREGGGLSVRVELPVGPGQGSSDQEEIRSREQTREPAYGAHHDD